MPSGLRRARRTKAVRAASFMAAESASRSHLSIRNDDRELFRMSAWFRAFAADGGVSADPGEIRTTVEDDGRPFDPLKSVLPEPARSLERASIGGWGIPIVRALADHIVHERIDGKNRLTVVFRS